MCKISDSGAGGEDFLAGDGRFCGGGGGVRSFFVARAGVLFFFGTGLQLLEVSEPEAEEEEEKERDRESEADEDDDEEPE